MDSTLERYATLLLDDCLGIEPGWQVVVYSTPLARPLLEELSRQIGERGAYALVRLAFEHEIRPPRAWIDAAPLPVLERLAPLEAQALDTADALLAIRAPENTRADASIDPDRLGALAKAFHPHSLRMLRHEVPWVLCQYPTPALAQDAGMSTDEFAEFLYGACLLDWDAERERMTRYAERFDAASEVRIVGAGTDLRLGIAGRACRVDAGGANMPGGEFFCSPVEDSAEGTIAFVEFPAPHEGRDVAGIRLRFEAGVVVEASAESQESHLLDVLGRDEGARRLGELGVGCNPGITRFMRNTGFDEKIDGTVHLALGAGFQDLGGTNESAVHWDIVKDLRGPGSRIELDGVAVQEDGRWLI